jgi:hypothetical protein
VVRTNITLILTAAFGAFIALAIFNYSRMFLAGPRNNRLLEMYEKEKK